MFSVQKRDGNSIHYRNMFNNHTINVFYQQIRVYDVQRSLLEKWKKIFKIKKNSA